jgi:hypothetical protein
MRELFPYSRDIAHRSRGEAGAAGRERHPKAAEMISRLSSVLTARAAARGPYTKAIKEAGRGGERSLDRGHFGCLEEKSSVRRDPRAGADLEAQIAVSVSSSKDAASPASGQRRSVAVGESVREFAPRLSALSILIRMVARGSAALIALREEVHDVARASLALQPCVECFGLFP